jgi:hypothetical protein
MLLVLGIGPSVHAQLEGVTAAPSGMVVDLYETMALTLSVNPATPLCVGAPRAEATAAKVSALVSTVTCNDPAVVSIWDLERVPVTSTLVYWKVRSSRGLQLESQAVHCLAIHRHPPPSTAL